MASHALYIATGSAPFSGQFQEMLDMLLTGAAFGQPTTLWLTRDCLAQLTLAPSDNLPQLPDFGVRCVTDAPAPQSPLPLERLAPDALLSLRNECDQILVF